MKFTLILVALSVGAVLMGCTHVQNTKRIPSSYVNCDSDFAQTEDECAALELWSPGNLSDANSLDKVSKFKIIYHSLTGVTNNSWIYSHLKNPKLIEKQLRVSASLISEKKHKTFLGRIGFILEVPKQNYIATVWQDVGSPDSTYKEFIEKSKDPSWDIINPNLLLKETTHYNELILLGTNPKYKTSIQVKGIVLDCPVKKMVKLNGLSDNDFNDFVSNCGFIRDLGLKKAIPLIQKLFTTYPVYAYPTFSLLSSEGFDPEI